jgi:hypothetical protein
LVKTEKYSVQKRVPKITFVLYDGSSCKAMMHVFVVLFVHEKPPRGMFM